MNSQNPPPKTKHLHPHGGKIFEKARKLLWKCPTGKHLLSIARDYNIKTVISSNPEHDGYDAEKATVYIYAPSSQNTAKAAQLLDMAGELRYAEQGIIGYGPPDPDSDPEERDSLEHAKNLDIIVESCKIYTELKNNKIGPKIKQEILKRGHKKIFEACEKQLGQDALLEAYIAMVKEEANKAQ